MLRLLLGEYFVLLCTCPFDLGNFVFLGCGSDRLWGDGGDDLSVGWVMSWEFIVLVDLFSMSVGGGISSLCNICILAFLIGIPYKRVHSFDLHAF
jgi:hypothetical protein